MSANVKRLFSYQGVGTDNEGVTLTHTCPKCGWSCLVEAKTWAIAWTALAAKVAAHPCRDRPRPQPGGN